MKLRRPYCAILGSNTVKIKEYKSMIVYVASSAMKLGLSQHVCEQREEEKALNLQETEGGCRKMLKGLRTP
jgi:hypothetical protein